MEDINRKHKDEMFSYVFKNKEHFKQLYEYITDNNIEDDIELFTLGDDIKKVLFNNKLINDVAFKTKDNKLIIMIEHQSTNNPNMALRLGLYYFNTIYNYIKDNSLDIYDKKAIDIPKPEFYVVYNGIEKMKEQNISLNNNFYDTKDNFININVKSVDINYIGLEGIVKDDINNIVNFYAYFIDEMRKRVPVYEIIEDCKRKGFTFNYLDNEEWIDMAFKEYTTADKIRHGIEDGIAVEVEKATQPLKEEIAKQAEEIAKQAEEMAKLKAELEKHKTKEIARQNKQSRDR